jgi:excinuclease ABC subunit C
MRKFDRKFGKEAHLSFPASPGIYRFYDETGKLIYVGKAKNLRRRLSQYRNAKRLKAHAKMRKIVEDACRVEHETCESEFHALALETEWIQRERPRWNVAGAFYFLYPMVGLRFERGQTFLCYSCSPSAFPGFRLHGAFRSRQRTRDGFFALVELLRLIGHPISKGQLPKLGVTKAEGERGYVYGFRQVPESWFARLESFLRGEDFSPIEELSLLLLERPTAVANGKQTQEYLHEIRRFWRHELQALRRAREHSKWTEYPVAQKDRDRLFIALRSKGLVGMAPRAETIA